MRRYACFFYCLAVAILSQGIAQAAPAPAGTALLISDIHFDPTADASLVDALAAAPPAEWERILAPSMAAHFSPYGEDTNWALLHSALDAMRRTIPQPDLVVLSGDYLVHDFRRKFDAAAHDHSNEAFNRFTIATMNFLAHELRQAFPKSAILPTLGNNDEECGDYRLQPDGPFLNGTEAMVRDLAHAAADPDFATSWRELGDYALTDPALPGVRLIFANTNFLSTHYSNSCGAKGEDLGKRVLAWLDAALAKARAAGQKAWLVYHIPPGMDAYATAHPRGAGLLSCSAALTTMWKPEYEAEFDALMAKYADIVSASFAGHTHMDEFRLVAHDGRDVGFVFQTPAISPNHAQNPSFRTVDYAADGALLDARTYYLANLSVSGGDTKGEWREESQFSKEWGGAHPDLAGFERIYARLGQEPQLEPRWAALYSVSNLENSGGITPASFKAYRCTIGNASTAAFGSCYCGGS